MGLPDIGFDRIRPHDGSRDVGFEELCSQLASLEPRPPGAAFIRKGRGADAGVECHLQYPNGTEKGWQAKYLFTWNSGLVSQLDESIRTALNKHPLLREYVVCLPFDLPDAHKANAKSARQKWNDWCTKWKNVAGAEGRTLEIGLWGRSELTARLVADNAKTGGRILYWFGDEAFSQAWFVEQFAKSKAALGARYTPETNVELPIRHDFLGFTRDDELQRQLDRWFIKVSDEGRYTTESIIRAANGGPETHSARISAAINDLKSLINGPAIGPEAKYPIIDWLKALTRCNEEVRDGLSWAYSLPESPGPGGSGINLGRRISQPRPS